MHRSASLRRCRSHPLGLVRTALLTVVVSCLGCQPHGAAGQTPVPSPESLEQARVIFGRDTVVVDVASTPREHETGLMFRDTIPDGTGMLFVFDDEAIRSFWMDNTYVDLDVAFMDAAYRIVDIQQLEAMDRETRESRAAFRYALEVPKGWLAAHGIQVGDTARIQRGLTGAGARRSPSRKPARRGLSDALDRGVDVGLPVVDVW